MLLLGVGNGVLAFAEQYISSSLAAALLVSMVGWSFGTVLAREKLDLPGGPMTTSVELLAGGAFQLTLSLLMHEQMKPLQPQAIAGWAYLAVVSIIGFTSYTIVIRRLRPTLASSFSYVNPAVALVLGSLIGGEHVSSIAVIGVGVIILGVLFISLAQRRK